MSADMSVEQKAGNSVCYLAAPTAAWRAGKSVAKLGQNLAAYLAEWWAASKAVWMAGS